MKSACSFLIKPSLLGPESQNWPTLQNPFAKVQLKCYARCPGPELLAVFMVSRPHDSEKRFLWRPGDHGGPPCPTRPTGHPQGPSGGMGRAAPAVGGRARTPTVKRCLKSIRYQKNKKGGEDLLQPPENQQSRSCHLWSAGPSARCSFTDLEVLFFHLPLILQTKRPSWRRRQVSQRHRRGLVMSRQAQIPARRRCASVEGPRRSLRSRRSG